MKTIERYIIKRSLFAFIITLAAMTGVVWSTQALRQLDLVTSKGQTLLQFGYITALALPFLILIVAPFAMMLAFVIVLNSMSRDSELIVINASGASKWLVLRPILTFSLIITAFMYFLSIYLSPTGLAELRSELTRVRVDLVANIIKPGRFIPIEENLTFHIRNRSGNGILEGLLLDDARDPETSFTYTAKTGRIIEAADKTLLVMLNGTIQRRPIGGQNMSIVSFESYGFDLSSMIPEAREPTFKASERPTFELLSASPDDSYAAKHWDKLIVEFHDRMSIPLYPIAFGLIIYALLGSPKTTRQDQGLAIATTIAVATLLRTAGFGATLVVSADPDMFPLLYAIPIFAIALAAWSISLSRRPWFVQRLVELTQRLINGVSSVFSKLFGRKNQGTASL
ncbi:LPS export ABC transporter permease LptF [Pseudovibrio sp. Tun.PSC04-5.I4]|uniref:LPS export ABC transporter permease LptF n=1 Tax=Pseudovibrio sp. Tun.PSC04-5.I4 TaxID=1798213 RepID=UPI000887589B|nr:LPS export ABC transporter permease LptF [Pseudovibrio sp. Tun.PSC04-5.I4]SDQ95348.1 lipopolysaccharide export system permease protein [Pseudovibrio sp. Tun.PSC04-5.I4]